MTLYSIIFLNNRDHRKITVIDGKVGFTGGYNLANEYFHITEPFGFWKDTGVRLEGDAVKSLTVTFLEMWNAIRDDDIDDVSFGKYLVNYDYTAKEKTYVLPYAGCQAVMDTKKDFEKMFTESNEVTEYYRSGRGSFLRFGQMLLRLVAPLM